MASLAAEIALALDAQYKANAKMVDKPDLGRLIRIAYDALVATQQPPPPPRPVKRGRGRPRKHPR